MDFVNTDSRFRWLATLMIALGTVANLCAQTTITSIKTTTTPGTPSTWDGHTFDNTSVSLNSFYTAAGQNYAVVSLANQAFVRRNSVDANQSSVWYALNGAGPDLLGSANASYPTLLLTNNLASGSDNTFANTPTGNDTGNIERLDFVFNSAVVASTSVGFAVFDRGAASVHDGFKIAAITGWDFVNNAPTSYGALTGLAGNWGSTNVMGDFTYDLFRYNQGDNITTSYASSETGTQGLGGVFFSMADLGITPGTAVYGYSLFGYDVTDGGTSSNLIDYTNATYFPTNTNNTTGSGGIDLASVNGISFSLIPEPSTYALCGAGMLALVAIISRRRTRAGIGSMQ